MVKGVAIKLKSYEETIPQALKLIKLDNEIKKHDKIVIKPSSSPGSSAKPDFIEPILKFCVENRSPGAEIFIADGCDGQDTMQVFEELGYKRLAEKYSVGLVDLNHADTEEVRSPDFLRFESVHYPKILLNSFVISTPLLKEKDGAGMSASIDNMLGAFPAKHYKSFFSRRKNKLDNYPVKYQVHDIIKCKMPDLAIIDASHKELVLIGNPVDMDRQAAKLLGLNVQFVEHLKLIEETASKKKKEEVQQLRENS